MLNYAWRKTALAVVAYSALTACGGGSGSSTHTGVFVDSAVQGLRYAATPSGLTGTTDAAGHFDYKDGDTVTFSLGGVTLGTTPALAQVTPKTIADAATSNDTDAANIASNIARFLQTFDTDGNPDNGITIDPAVAAAATTPIDFDKTPEDFTADPGYVALTTSTNTTPISNEQAAAHTERSALEQLAGTWVHTNSAQHVLLTVTFFSDGSYLKGGEENDPDCGSNNGNGVELGNFSYDAANATLTVTGVGIETDGSCGLGNGTVLSNVTIDGNTLSFTADDGVVTLTKAANNGIVGSWLADQPLAGQQLTHPVVVTFLANGDYVMADSGIAELDDAAVRGSERGIWSVNGSNVLTSTQTVNTNGEAGFSDLEAGTKLLINGNGKLVLQEPGQSDITFTRLPLTPKINAGDLTGAWYISGPDGTEDVTTESTAADYIVFRQDGTYLLGSQEDDPDCYNDYANDGYDAHGNTSGNLASYADGSNGSESAHWRLNTGTGVLSTYGLVFETNGSCGLYNVYSKFPENRLILDKVDGNTINVTTYEFQDGGTGEGNSHSFAVNHFVLKRIPSGNNSLTGAWKKDGVNKTTLFFGSGFSGSFFTIGGNSAGGVTRGSYTYDVETYMLIKIVDGSSDACIDTISATSMCDSPSPVSASNALTFGSNFLTFSLSDDGGSYSKL